MRRATLVSRRRKPEVGEPSLLISDRRTTRRVDMQGGPASGGEAGTEEGSGLVEMGKGLASFHGQYTAVVSATPRECPGCRLPKTMFINRDGRTLCAECDASGGPDKNSCETKRA